MGTFLPAVLPVPRGGRGRGGRRRAGALGSSGRRRRRAGGADGGDGEGAGGGGRGENHAPMGPIIDCLSKILRCCFLYRV